MLILFDIDGTLITTGGVGIRAMVGAGRELFGPDFTADGIDFAGRLDPLILRDMFEISGVPWTPANQQAMRQAYGRHLKTQLINADKRSLPGVSSLVSSLLETPAALGLLTGNFRETGCLKLRACGIEPDHFPVQAWGDESPHSPPARNHLPPIAMRRHIEVRGTPIDPGRVTIIGDTPHDIACAKAHGCRSLGVATGRSSTDDLAAAGADLAVVNLSDTKALMGWLMGSAAFS